jgi:hypothetical protein
MSGPVASHSEESKPDPDDSVPENGLVLPDSIIDWLQKWTPWLLNAIEKIAFPLVRASKASRQ